MSFTFTTCRTSWCSPDWCRGLAGRKVVLDVHDSVPETFAAKFSDGAILQTALCLEERLSALVAHKVICVNHPQRDALVGSGIPTAKTFVSMNVPDPRLFGSSIRTGGAPLGVRPAEPRVPRHDGRTARSGPPYSGRVHASERRFPMFDCICGVTATTCEMFQHWQPSLLWLTPSAFNPNGFPLEELP